MYINNRASYYTYDWYVRNGSTKLDNSLITIIRRTLRWKQHKRLIMNDNHGIFIYDDFPIKIFSNCELLDAKSKGACANMLPWYIT